MSANQKVCDFVAVGELGMAYYIYPCLLFIFMEWDERERLGDRMEHLSWKWNIHNREGEYRASQVSTLSVLSIISIRIHSLLPLQIYCFLIHVLTCRVMTSRKTHLYCLMPFSNSLSLSSALPLVPFIDTESGKGRHFYHLVWFFVQITMELSEYDSSKL